jgi:hypothetical protein
MRLHASFGLWLWLFLLLAGAARAQSEAEPPVGSTSSGLCGLVYTGAPQCTRGLTLSGTVGYGTTKLHGQHDRLIGNIGVAYVPLNWLAFSLELDGRIDIHPDDEQGKDVTGTGDPWLRTRVGWPVGRGVSLGGELGVWLPGNDAPSYTASATTVDVKGQLSWATPGERWALLGLFGGRIDNSANSAPDVERLRVGDRISLGLSDSSALLVGVGLAHRPLRKLQVFGELSADVLVGKQAPSFSQSPMRAALGARYFALDALALELSLLFSLSQRPSVAPDAPLVPIEPRFSALIGLRYGLLRPTPPPVAGSEPVVPVEQTPREEPKALAALRGVLTDQVGAALPDVPVMLNFPGGQQETISDAEGRYVFSDVPPGKVTLSANATGFQPSMWEVEVSAPATQAPPHALTQADGKGSLRCLVRSYRSEPLKADVVVRDARGRRVGGGTTDAQGVLEIPLTPGQYRVMIDAPGFKSQRSNVQVAPNEIAILNVDMREGK